MHDRVYVAIGCMELPLTHRAFERFLRKCTCTRDITIEIYPVYMSRRVDIAIRRTLSLPQAVKDRRRPRGWLEVSCMITTLWRRVLWIQWLFACVYSKLGPQTGDRRSSGKQD